MAHQYLVALDIEIDGSKSLLEAHKISSFVEAEIKKQFQIYMI